MNETTTAHEHEPERFGIGGEYPGYKTVCRLCGIAMELEWDVSVQQRQVRAGIWAAKAGRAQAHLDRLTAIRQHIASLPDRWRQTDLDGYHVLYWQVTDEWMQKLKELIQ